MSFSDPRVQTVFERYEARAAADQERMAALGPAGFAKRDEFLLPIGADVGRVLHALVLARKPRRILELGTSYGYSTLFLADAARAVDARVVSMDIADYKQRHAHSQLVEAGLADRVEFRCGDAVAALAADPGSWDFVLLDVWKELYLPCFEALYPKLSEEGMIASDNMIEPELNRESVRHFREAVRSKRDMQAALLPIGQGIELAIRWTSTNPKL